MSNEYGAIPLSTANAVGASLKKKMGSLTGYAPVDWAETINKLGNKLPERTVSGAVCTFSDGADDVPMPSVKASITAVQAGSGDPSPSNVRAISGFAECDVTHTKKNLFDPNTAFSAVGSYMYAKAVLPSNTKLICSFTDNDTTVDISGLYIGFYDDTYTGGNVVSGHFRWLIENGRVNSSNLTNKTSSNILCNSLFAYPKNQSTIDTILARYNIQIELGSTATDYEPYAGETIPVWMGGVNLWGGEKMADDVVSAVNNSSRAYKGEDTNGKYLAISAGSGLNVPWYTNFKENTQYTIILKASKSNSATTTNIRFYYTDDSTSAISFPESPVSGTVYTIVATSIANKTIKQIEGVYNSGITYVYYEQSGLFEGVKTAQDFESVRYIYGGELNLTTGVLTVTHLVDDLANLSWTTPYTGSTNKTIYATLSDYYDVSTPEMTAEKYVFIGKIPSSSSLSNPDNFNVGMATFSNGTNRNTLYMILAVADTPSGKVMYKLATPTTIQLTPEEVRSFLGTNNLWANTGDTEVTYFAQPNVPTEVLYKGQISTTSDYATANFTESVEDDEEILVKVYCPARSAVDYKVIKVSDIGNGLNVGFSLHTTVNCTITKTSIASYQYSGDYYDIYADVLAYDSAIFN